MAKNIRNRKARTGVGSTVGSADNTQSFDFNLGGEENKKQDKTGQTNKKNQIEQNTDQSVDISGTGQVEATEVNQPAPQRKGEGTAVVGETGADLPEESATEEARLQDMGDDLIKAGKGIATFVRNEWERTTDSMEVMNAPVLDPDFEKEAESLDFFGAMEASEQASKEKLEEKQKEAENIEGYKGPSESEAGLATADVGLASTLPTGRAAKTAARGIKAISKSNVTKDLAQKVSKDFSELGEQTANLYRNAVESSKKVSENMGEQAYNVLNDYLGVQSMSSEFTNKFDDNALKTLADSNSNIKSRISSAVGTLQQSRSQMASKTNMDLSNPEAISRVENFDLGPLAGANIEDIGKAANEYNAGDLPFFGSKTSRDILDDEALETLDYKKEADKRFGREKKPFMDFIKEMPQNTWNAGEKAIGSIGKIDKAFRDKHSLWSSLEKKLYKIHGKEQPRVDMASKLHQVNGAPGKAEADLHNFKTRVMRNLRGNEEEFNDFLFFKRAESRLKSDPERKKIKGYDLNTARGYLKDMKNRLGENKFRGFEVMGDVYHQVMDEAMQLQVDAGKMSQEAFDLMKKENDFYAPFQIIKHLEKEEGSDVTTSGIRTAQQLTKKIKGIEDEDFQVSDILGESARYIVRSRLLAEKNKKMREVARLADLDEEGRYIRKVKEGDEAQPGNQKVSYFENGEKKFLEMSNDLADSLGGATPQQSGIIGNIFKKFVSGFKQGAVTWNAKFQVANTPVALLRQAALQKYGLETPEDVIKYPLDFFESFISAGLSKVGKNTQLYQDFLKSGGANSSIQRSLDEVANVGNQALDKEAQKVMSRSLPSMAGRTLDKPSQFISALDEGVRMIGYKQGMRKLEKMKKKKNISQEEVAEIAEEISDEVRNYAGGPDYFKKGSAVEKFNGDTFIPFLTATTQAITKDIGRVTIDAAKGKREGLSAVGKIAPLIGWYGYNHYQNKTKHKEDYDKIPQWEKENYSIHMKDEFAKDANGNPLTDSAGRKLKKYDRIPKREFAKMYANLTEDFVNYTMDNDFDTADLLHGIFAETAGQITGIGGATGMEAARKSISRLAPPATLPVEYSTNTDLFFGNDIIPERLKNVKPHLQYKEDTPAFYIDLAEKLHENGVDTSPIMMRHVVNSMTAQAFEQFRTTKNAAGKEASNAIEKKFQPSYKIEDKDVEKIINERLQSQDTEKAKQRNEARKKYKELSSLSSQAEIKGKLAELAKKDPELAKEVTEIAEWKSNGLSYNERQLMDLNVNNFERAKAIYDIVQKKDFNQQEVSSFFSSLAKSGVLSEKVINQIGVLRKMGGDKEKIDRLIEKAKQNQQ